MFSTWRGGGGGYTWPGPDSQEAAEQEAEACHGSAAAESGGSAGLQRQAVRGSGAAAACVRLSGAINDLLSKLWKEVKILGHLYLVFFH